MFRHRGDQQLTSPTPFGSLNNEENGGSSALDIENNNRGNKNKSLILTKNMTQKMKYLIGIILFTIIIYSFLILMETGLGSVTIEEEVKQSHNSREHYTIVINTFNRTKLVSEAIEHYSKCSHAKYIHIVWSEPHEPKTKFIEKLKKYHDPSVIIDIHNQDSLNNRFKPLKESFTEGIFTVDDDIRVTCTELNFAFDVWRLNRNNIIGFMPRTHVHSIKTNRLIYRAWWYVWWTGSYSIILTKAAFLNHKYFNDYTNNFSNEMKEYIDQRRNCEDITMQFLISNITRLSPIFVKGHLTDLGALNGISTSQNVIKASHMDERSECLNKLVDIFHYNPLLKSHIVVDTVTNRWAAAPSTWWEYISSDLWNFDSMS